MQMGRLQQPLFLSLLSFSLSLSLSRSLSIYLSCLSHSVESSDVNWKKKKSGGIKIICQSESRDFSAMAFITDHVNSLIEQWFPGESTGSLSSLRLPLLSPSSRRPREGLFCHVRHGADSARAAFRARPITLPTGVRDAPPASPWVQL